MCGMLGRRMSVGVKITQPMTSGIEAKFAKSMVNAMLVGL